MRQKHNADDVYVLLFGFWKIPQAVDFSISSPCSESRSVSRGMWIRGLQKIRGKGKFALNCNGLRSI